MLSMASITKVKPAYATTQVSRQIKPPIIMTDKRMFTMRLIAS